MDRLIPTNHPQFSATFCVPEFKWTQATLPRRERALVAYRFFLVLMALGALGSPQALPYVPGERGHVTRRWLPEVTGAWEESVSLSAAGEG